MRSGFTSSPLPKSINEGEFWGQSKNCSIPGSVRRRAFLVQLNGQYGGAATGETFNCQGKTDILIKEKGRNVFVAECKFWRGEKFFLDTINQHLSYLTWRDTRSAILIFNRNSSFSEVLEKIQAIIPTHELFNADLGKLDETSFRYSFCHPSDPTRLCVVSLLAFNVPTPRAPWKRLIAINCGNASMSCELGHCGTPTLRVSWPLGAYSWPTLGNTGGLFHTGRYFRTDAKKSLAKER
jgi:hypothetical protein